MMIDWTCNHVPFRPTLRKTDRPASARQRVAIHDNCDERTPHIAPELDGTTHKALSDALKRLERGGLVSLRISPTQPIGVEYTITKLGGSLREPFAALYTWWRVHGAELERAQVGYDASREQRGDADQGG